MRSTDGTTGTLTQDEAAVIEKIRQARFGTLEVRIKDSRIVGYAFTATYLPPSMDGNKSN